MSRDRKVELIARGVCVRSGKLLVCRSGTAWNTFLPGGHIEFGEGAPSALKREIAEEMDREARVGCFLGAVEHTFVKKGNAHGEVNLVFEFDIDGLTVDEPPVAAEPQITFEWLPLDRLRESTLEPSPLRECLPEWLNAPEDPCRWASTHLRFRHWGGSGGASGPGNAYPLD